MISTLFGRPHLIHTTISEKDYDLHFKMRTLTYIDLAIELGYIGNYLFLGMNGNMQNFYFPLFFVMLYHIIKFVSHPLSEGREKAPPQNNDVEQFPAYILHARAVLLINTFLFRG